MINADIFGRENYLEIIEKRVRHLKQGYRQNLAIIADELIGKTAIICKFLSRFQDNEVVPVYIETRPESFLQISRRFIAILLYNFLQNSGLTLEEDLGFLLKKAERYIPKTVAKARCLLSAAGKGRRVGLFTELLSLSESIFEETGKCCVVIIDEFHGLESAGIKNIYQEWSSLLMLQRHTMYIILSSRKFKARLLLSKELSLLFGNFETINVEPFDIKTSAEFINYKLKGIELDSGYKNFLIHFTAGIPFYLSQICEALLNDKSRGLEEVLQNLIFETSGALNQRFSNYIKIFSESAHSNEYISILYLIASGRNRIKELAQILRRPIQHLAQRVNKLLELDTLTRNADFLFINDRLFGFWLRFVYQEKLCALTFDAKNQQEAFRFNISGMIREFLLSSRKTLVDRITEIMQSFSDESLQIEKRRLKLNHFQEIKRFEFSKGTLAQGLIGRSSQNLWIMAIKPQTLNEEDIANFAKECRRHRHKAQRRIIITTDEIDANTRLRALEEKIMAWDINDLNQIMDLFSQPRVIA